MITVTASPRVCLNCGDLLPRRRLDHLCQPCRDICAAQDAQECARCGDYAPPKNLYARGLCSACYTAVEHLGKLGAYPDSAELDWIDYQWLRSWGIAVEQCAERLGMEFRTALKYERRRRGADYAAWLASLSDADRERYNLAA